MRTSGAPAGSLPSHQPHTHPSSGAPCQWAQFKSALNSDRPFEYGYWLSVGVSTLFDWAVRALGPCLVTLACLLIGLVTCLYFGYILPELVGCRGKGGSGVEDPDVRYLCLARVIHGSWAAFLLFNTLFNYFHCVMTSPGSPFVNACDASMHSHGEIQAPSVHANAGTPTDSHSLLYVSSARSDHVDARTYGFCKKCRTPRPPRTHHCHVCKSCVLKMDHHCPWIGQCVGHYNYRYFVLFMMYLWAACVYGALLLGRPFLEMMYGSGQGGGPRMPVIVGSLASARSAIILTFVLAFSVGLALTGLLGWHVFLITTGQTTIEFYINKARRERARQRGFLYTNPHDLGSRQNWQQVFGRDLPWWRSLLPSTRLPPAPGVGPGGPDPGEEKAGAEPREEAWWAEEHRLSAMEEGEEEEEEEMVTCDGGECAVLGEGKRGNRRRGGGAAVPARKWKRNGSRKIFAGVERHTPPVIV